MRRPRDEPCDVPTTSTKTTASRRASILAPTAASYGLRGMAREPSRYGEKGADHHIGTDPQMTNRRYLDWLDGAYVPPRWQAPQRIEDISVRNIQHHPKGKGMPRQLRDARRPPRGLFRESVKDFVHSHRYLGVRQLIKRK